MAPDLLNVNGNYVECGGRIIAQDLQDLQDATSLDREFDYLSQDARG